jgi:CheY-like chemotaxis protein
MLPPAILLVDDDQDYLEIATRALRQERLEVEVHVARAGAEALSILGIAGAPAPTAPLNLVAAFVDLDMPGLDGWEVLRRVRADERLRRLPVVIVSSSSRPEDIRRSYDLGANSYVVKQYDPAGPGRHVARAMRYWLELNAVSPRGSRRPA